MTPLSAEKWNAALHGGAVLDLSAHSRLRLTGPDAARYLNGQVTNDVKRLEPGGAALPACVTNHKGKLEAFVWLSRDKGGALYVTGDADRAEFLPVRLGKYLIADDAELEDISEATALIHLTGAADAASAFLTEGERAVSCARLGAPGTDIWTTPERAPFWLEKGLPLTSEEADTVRTLLGVPSWGRELTPDLLPPEAGLDRTAVDFHKGCYIGQEVISRIRSAGKLNRTLEALSLLSGPPPEAGWTLFSEEGAAGPAAGTVTGAAENPVTGEWRVLAYVKRGAGPTLLAGAAGSDLPTRLEIRKTLDE